MKELFNKPKDNNEQTDTTPKPPLNIFSKPVNVAQSAEARKSRIKIVIIEGLLFGAFLTAITAIYSISGLDLKLNPEAQSNSPSVLFFIVEFVLFSGLVGVGDYFLTEKRVNEYNQKMAGLSFNIDDEIEKALKEQEQDGISALDAAALNKTNGEEKPDVVIEDVSTDESPMDKAFEAHVLDKKVGKIESCKAYILDSAGIEQVIIRVSKFEVMDDFAKSDVGTKLFAKLKESALEDGFSVIEVTKDISDKYELKLLPADKFSIKLVNDNGEEKNNEQEVCICELYPGALM